MFLFFTVYTVEGAPGYSRRKFSAIWESENIQTQLKIAKMSVTKGLRVGTGMVEIFGTRNWNLCKIAQFRNTGFRH